MTWKKEMSRHHHYVAVVRNDFGAIYGAEEKHLKYKIIRLINIILYLVDSLILQMKQLLIEEAIVSMINILYFIHGDKAHFQQIFSMMY